MTEKPQRLPPDSAKLQEMALALLHTEARCKGCGYRLRGLTEPRCPECGLPFDPQDRWSYDVPGRKKLHTAQRPLTPREALVVLGVLCVGLLSLYRMVASGILQGLVPVVLVGLLSLWRHRQLKRSSAADGEPKRMRLGWQVALLIVLLLVRYEACRCDHASALAFGWVGIAYSKSHGPCHNPPFQDDGIHVHLFGHWWLAKMDRP